MQQSIPRLDYGLPWFEECKRITVYHASAQAQTPPTLLPSEMQSIGRRLKKRTTRVFKIPSRDEPWTQQPHCF